MSNAASRRARDLAERLTWMAAELDREDLPATQREDLEARVSAVAHALTDLGDLTPTKHRSFRLYRLLRRAIDQGRAMVGKGLEPADVANAQAAAVREITAESDPELGTRLARKQDLLLETLSAAIGVRGGRGNRQLTPRRERVERLFGALGMGASAETLRRGSR